MMAQQCQVWNFVQVELILKEQELVLINETCVSGLFATICTLSLGMRNNKCRNLIAYFGYVTELSKFQVEIMEVITHRVEFSIRFRHSFRMKSLNSTIDLFLCGLFAWENWRLFWHLCTQMKSCLLSSQLAETNQEVVPFLCPCDALMDRWSLPGPAVLTAQYGPISVWIR